MTLALAPRRRSRQPSLTPMIDVVFLLLVFFMLASRFGADASIQIEGGAARAGNYEGPPRLVDVYPEGVRLNGSDIREPSLAKQLRDLMRGPSDVIVLRARDNADVQRVVTVMEALGAAGFTGLVMVE
ncbi:ExbD/TolR family protein [Aliiroseovarius sp. PTFE2010]|uniref:ExbD/TolR family protein n=1 Tax=Aliiroseovarius sp. PTFE2010 TaxID=3417190 RepID=UPI003CEB72A2